MGRSLGSGMRGFRDSLSGEGTQLALSNQGEQPTPIVAPDVSTAVPAAERRPPAAG